MSAITAACVSQPFCHDRSSMLPSQDDQEPICIDSDEDTPANGAEPARADSQNGAAVATRHSERIHANQSTRTVQRFKVTTG